MPIYRSTERVEAWTFDELIAEGRRVCGANIVSGTPWSFQFAGAIITHETNDIYIVNGVKFTRNDMFVKSGWGWYVTPTTQFLASYAYQGDIA